MGINLPVRWNNLIRLLKRSSILIILMCAAVICVFAVCFRSYGHMHIRVVDAYTLIPIEGAQVIIPDTGSKLISDNTGSCIFTGIPLHKNHLHQRILQQDCGECTIIALYDGYRPTVILNARVEKGRMRNGPTMYMFPNELDDTNVAVIVESPDEEWIMRLVEKYAD